MTRVCPMGRVLIEAVIASCPFLLVQDQCSVTKPQDGVSAHGFVNYLACHCKFWHLHIKPHAFIYLRVTDEYNSVNVQNKSLLKMATFLSKYFTINLTK